MENLPIEITSAERDFYGDRLILLEGAIEEFLSCLQMIRCYQVSRGQRDPIASFQARSKSADSMKAKLERQNLPVTADSALQDVWDAAGVRLVAPLSRILTRRSASSAGFQVFRFFMKRTTSAIRNLTDTTAIT